MRLGASKTKESGGRGGEAMQLRFRKYRYSPVLNLNNQVSNIAASYEHARIYNDASEKPRPEEGTGERCEKYVSSDHTRPGLCASRESITPMLRA